MGKLILFLKRLVRVRTRFDQSTIGAQVIGERNLITIGKNVSFGGNVVLYANSEISIGDHSMLAMNVVLHTSTHNYDNHPMWLERVDRPIRIGSHVWIGLGAIISPGVVIGDFAVIGAGSVVVSNVPELAIAAGNPARILKYRTLAPRDSNRVVSDYPKGSFVTKGELNNKIKICKRKNE